MHTWWFDVSDILNFSNNNNDLTMSLFQDVNKIVRNKESLKNNKNKDQQGKGNAHRTQKVKNDKIINDAGSIRAIQ
jgi:hypothetical protein